MIKGTNNSEIKTLLWTGVGLIALVFVCWVCYHQTQCVYECKHEAMAKFLAEETRGWYYGKHGETLTPDQYDWAYNEASEALQTLGNATSK